MEEIYVMTVVGPHAGKPLAEIFKEKIREVNDYGLTYWFQAAVLNRKPFRKHGDKVIKVLFLEATSSNGAKDTAVADKATEVETAEEGVFGPIDKRLTVTGNLRQGAALELVSLKEVSYSIDLSDYSTLGDEDVVFGRGKSTIITKKVEGWGSSMATPVRKVVAEAVLGPNRICRVKTSESAALASSPSKDDKVRTYTSLAEYLRLAVFSDWKVLESREFKSYFGIKAKDTTAASVSLLTTYNPLKILHYWLNGQGSEGTKTTHLLSYAYRVPESEAFVKSVLSSNMDAATYFASEWLYRTEGESLRLPSCVLKFNPAQGEQSSKGKVVAPFVIEDHAISQSASKAPVNTKAKAYLPAEAILLQFAEDCGHIKAPVLAKYRSIDEKRFQRLKRLCSKVPGLQAALPSIANDDSELRAWMGKLKTQS